MASSNLAFSLSYMAREHLTEPLYGYIVYPAARKKWIVDEEAAAVVKRVFNLCIA